MRPAVPSAALRVALALVSLAAPLVPSSSRRSAFPGPVDAGSRQAIPPTRYWKDGDAVGRRLDYGGGGWATVVGVARDGKYNAINEPPLNYLYIPVYQAFRPDISLMVRTAAGVTVARRAHGAFAGPEAARHTAFGAPDRVLSRRSPPSCRRGRPVILPLLLHWLKAHGRPLARAGCVAIGTVYVLVGTFALFALSGRFIENADEDRIVAVLLGVPGGWVLIWGIVAGAAGYVVWRIIEVLADPYEFGSDPKGLAIRGGVALSAIGYGLIALSAARIARRGVRAVGSDAPEQEQQDLVAQVLEWPAGELVVGIVGAIVLIVGLMQFGLVVRRAYTTEVRMKPLSATAQRVIHVLAWYGYAARGVILCVLGYFLLKGAVTHDPSAVGDTDTAFDFIGGGLIGDTAFAIVAIGTVAYGIFMYANAWHYRFEAHPDEPVPGAT